MNSYAFVFVAAVAVLCKSATANCISNVLLPSPILTPYSPIVSAPILPTTTIVQTNSVTESLVDVLQMLPVCNLLNNQLCPNLVLPIGAPILSPPILSPCGCGCGLNTIIF